MKKLWTGFLCLGAVTAIFTGCFLIGDHLINAQSTESYTYTGDGEAVNLTTSAAENSGVQPLSSDVEISLQIHTGPDGMVMSDPITLNVNGTPNVYMPDGNGIVRIMADLSMGDVLIEPTPEMYVEYHPASITVEAGNVLSLYELWRMDLDTYEEGVNFTLVDKSTAENETFAATKKVTLPKGESAQIELTLPPTYPNGTIYYGYSTTSDASGVAQYEVYNGVITVSENTTLCAYADETAVGGDESIRVCRLITFLEENDPANPGDPIEKPDPNKDLTYKDDLGNVYTNEEVTLQITAMEEKSDYEALIRDFPEFKYITSDHVVFLDVKLMAAEIEVQPDSPYELILPYPDGSAAKDEFVLYHFINGALDTYENINFTAEADGIHCTINATGAFVIGWKETATTDISKADRTAADDDDNKVLESRLNGKAGGINTGDTSNPALWMMICFSEIAAGIYYVRKMRQPFES